MLNAYSQSVIYIYQYGSFMVVLQGLSSFSLIDTVHG